MRVALSIFIETLLTLEALATVFVIGFAAWIFLTTGDTTSVYQRFNPTTPVISGSSIHR